MRCDKLVFSTEEDERRWCVCVCVCFVSTMLFCCSERRTSFEKGNLCVLLLVGVEIEIVPRVLAAFYLCLRDFFEHESFQVFVHGLLHRASPAVQNNYSHWSMPTSSAHQHQSSPNNTPVPPRSSTPNTTIDPTLRLHGGSRLELGARLLVPAPGRPPN